MMPPSVEMKRSPRGVDFSMRISLARPEVLPTFKSTGMPVNFVKASTTGLMAFSFRPE